MIDDEFDEEEEIGPGDPDYDLSEAHGYTWEPERDAPIAPWLMALISLLVIVALVIPGLLIVWQYR